MQPATRFNLLLLGYRNDLARERVMEAVSGLPREDGGPADLGRDSPLPCTLYEGIACERGLRICAALRSQGAQVRLVPMEGEPPTLVTEDFDRPRRRSGPVALLLLLVGALGVVTFFMSHRGPDGRPAHRGAGRHARPAYESARLRRLNDDATALNQNGRYAQAARRLRTALRMDPDQPLLRRNLRTVLANWAVAELNDGRPEEAAHLAEEAIQVEEDQRMLEVLGVAYARRGQWSAAQRAMERAIALGADEPDLLVALGKVYDELGKREKAVEMLQKAREKGATGDEFGATLSRLERELDAEWGFAERVSPHFSVSYAEGENRRAADVVLDSLEEAYEIVGHRFGRYPADRIDVVLYAEQAFHDVTQTPGWAGGVYDGRIKMPVRGLESRTPLLDRTLRHEYAHVIVAQLSGGRCPAWVNEGLAVWAEADGRTDRRAWAHKLLRGRRLLPFAELEVPFMRLPGGEVQTAYAQSYLAVDELIEEHGMRVMEEFLDRVGRKEKVAHAFAGAFLTDVVTFEERMADKWSG